LHRRLVEEVHALEEPYRSAILLRFLRGQSPAEIARELAVPVKTVRTRIERGLAKLRERLDRDHGSGHGADRAAWLVVLARAPRGAASIPLPLSLLLPMNVKAACAIVGLLLIGAYLVLRGNPAESARSTLVASERIEAPASVPATTPAEAQREVVPGAPTEPGKNHPNRAAPAPAIPTVQGFVRTIDGAGLADIEVVFERASSAGFEPADGARTQSGARGAFELALAGEPGRINVADETYVGIALPHLDGARPLTEPIVVVAPGYAIAGRVVDPAGNAIAGAAVEVTLDGSFVQSRNVGGEAVHLLLPFAAGTCDERGEFRLARVGFVEGAFLSASAEGYRPGRLELGEGPHEDVELVLATGKEERTLFGVVLEASGAPAQSALVSVGGLSVPCAADGSFALDLESWRTDGWLRAVRLGALPAEMPLPDALVAPTSREHPLVLRLGTGTLAIRGRVVDESGAPVP